VLLLAREVSVAVFTARREGAAIDADNAYLILSEQPMQETDDQESLKPLAIEGKLPLKAVGIENLREANPQYLPPHRYLHPWFARRPTPASRLAILASVLPKGTDSDDLLRWMQIGPNKEIEGGLSDYVERKKATEDERSGNLESHYG